MVNQGQSSMWDVMRHESTKLETLHLLKRTIPTSLFAVTLLSLIIGYIAYPFTSLTILAPWVLALLLTFALRFSFAKQFEQEVNQTNISADKWLLRFRLATVSTGLVWALGEIAILHYGQGFDYEHYVFLTFVATGFFVGAMLALSVDWPTMMGSCMPSLAPLLWAFIEMGDATALSTGASLALFLAYIYITALRHGRSLHENLYLRLRAVEDEKKLKQVLNNSPIGACISDLKGDNLLFYNQRYRDMLKGYVNSHQALRSLMSKDDYTSVTKSLNQGGVVTDKLISLVGETPNQPTKWVLASFTRFEHEQKPSVLSWYYDITDRKQMEEHAEHMAYHDPLTQLPNRMLFNDRLEKGVQQAKRDNKKLAIMYIDLDGFKNINDEYGHHVGDALLKDVAKRMVHALREVDTIARLGGDEFGALMLMGEDVDVMAIAKKLCSAIDQDYIVDARKHWLTASIGIAIYPDHGETETVLLQRADTAMYKVKKQGRNNVMLYESA